MQACRDRIAGLPLERGSNAGLLLTRYLREAADTGSSDPKSKFLNAREELIASAVRTQGALKPVYELAFKRWEAAIKALGPSASDIFKTIGRTVIGLGEDSPIETGLHLHHTFGVPVIPGTGLKGLASHHCGLVWGERDEAFKRGGAHYRNMFGDTESAGHLIFPDAWMLPEDLTKGLQPDVITVHHPDYYQSADGGKGPTDFDDPRPIPFVSVVGRFKIVVACGAAGETAASWAKLGLALLSEALEDWGIGGKTSSGYGRLQSRNAAAERTADAPRAASASASASSVSAGGAARAPASTPVVLASPAEAFKKWFDRQNLTGGRNRGDHQLIVTKLKAMEDNPEEWRKAADYVLSQIPKKKDTTTPVWEYLHPDS